jgi:hypothetical protein
MKQTAVEFIFEELENRENGSYSFTMEQIYNKAKEIEKQQIIDARVNGVCEGIDIGARPIGKPITEDISKNHEIYYNETFNK